LPSLLGMVRALCPACDPHHQGWVRTPDPAGQADYSRCPTCNPLPVVHPSVEEWEQRAALAILNAARTRLQIVPTTWDEVPAATKTLYLRLVRAVIGEIGL